MRGTTEGQPPAAPEFLVITADGYYSESELPEGREKVSKPLDQMTKEELVARYSRTAASWGTYTIVGNLLSRRHIMDLNPRAEGSDQARNFHFEGDILVLTAGGPGDTPSGARGGRAGEGPQAGGPPAGGRAGDGPQAGGRAGGGPQGRGGALVVRFKRMKQ
ncbi:MAG: lipocalin-like domain-containing protein [Terriglobia bacterium]